MLSDNSNELLALGRLRDLSHPTSTPYRPNSNAEIERAHDMLIQGTRAVLAPSGLENAFWPFAARRFARG